MNEQMGVVTYYRVQGGIMPSASLKTVSLQDGKLSLNQDSLNGRMTKSVFFGNYEHMTRFMEKRCKGAVGNSGEPFENLNLEVVVNRIPKLFNEFIGKNVVSQSAQASQKRPVVCDPSMQGVAYELNNHWRDLLFACSVYSDIVEIKSKQVKTEFLSNESGAVFNKYKKIDQDKVIKCLIGLIKLKQFIPKGTKMNENNENKKILGLATLFDDIENNPKLFECGGNELKEKVDELRKFYNYTLDFQQEK